MKTFLTNPLLILLVLILMELSCRKKENLIERVDNMNFTSDIYKKDGAIDEWLFKNFTEPYNIRVQYKWDRSEVDLSKTITPVDESKIIPVGQYILKYYLQPYAEEAGEFFIKKCPSKQYMFVGSAQYNSNGTVTLGSADAGRKVILYRLNEIDAENWSAVQRMLKTIHHEFVHILDQTRRMTPEYGNINKADYVDDTWSDSTEQAGLDLGFITPYSRSNPNEDLAEIVSVLLVYGQDYFDSKVASAALHGQVNLRKKENLVVDYFKTYWNIDFRSLQKRISDLMPETAEPVLPLFLDSYGEGKTYSIIQVDTDEIEPGFKPVWDEIKEEMITETNREIAYMRLYLLSENQLLVRVYRYAEGAGNSGDVTYSRLYFNIAQNSNGTIKFIYTESGSDGSNSSASLRNSTDKLVSFLEGNNFKWDWANSSMTGGGIFVVDENGDKSDVAMTGELRN